MTRKSPKRLKGKWRIVEMELWGKDHLDLVGPAHIALDGKGHGELGFGALVATLDCAFVPGGVEFSWQGFEEGDEVFGEGWVELEDDGSLTGEFSYHDGDESGFLAQPW
jgi:hypothetical protein